MNFIVIALLDSPPAPGFRVMSKRSEKANIPSNFSCKYKSSFRHKSPDISMKMYQMNDKVLLTKKSEPNVVQAAKCETKAPERQKGKLNISSAISVIARGPNMFHSLYV